MSSGFPLVRAADITPFLLWQRDNGRQINDALELAHLPVAPWEEPDRPIPLLGALEVMRSLSEEEGPDVACRVVSETSISELGELGEMVLAGRTPREALTLLCDAIEQHSSHEQFMLVPASGGITVHEQIALDLDQETRHVVQQYVAALIRSLFRMTGFSGQPFGRVEMSPHPRFGLAHIRKTLGSVVSTSSGKLIVAMSDDVLDRPFLAQYRGGGSGERSSEQTLLQGMPFKAGAKLFIAMMLEEGLGQLSVAHLATASGLSRRTTQRMLAEENTSFSCLVDEVRRDRALEELGRAATPIGLIAADLGYSGQQAFVRAVRRWTGKSPREFRRNEGVVAGR